MKPLIYIVILGVCWIVAFYFYFNNVAQWESSPAVSRAKNKNCIILGFYDNHDVWHFISATALFFSFLVSSKKLTHMCTGSIYIVCTNTG